MIYLILISCFNRFNKSSIKINLRLINSMHNYHITLLNCFILKTYFLQK